ncbi:MAG: DUF5069 domain-containing protein [Opitutaceae bacterium]|nr:DUF5069 domain-containing protein [Opitutaceae bacterium]
MIHYDFPKKFRDVYERAIASYRDGCREAASLLSKADLEYAVSIGSRAQDFFDYAEDAANYGEPDFETALLVQAIRRDYFLQVQKGRASSVVLDVEKMPAKTDAVRGIEWLPRIIPKTKAKLRGELPSSLMYGCGGDRRFFKQHDIHPAEFLHVVWANENDDEAIIAWVEARAKAVR